MNLTLHWYLLFHWPINKNLNLKSLYSTCCWKLWNLYECKYYNFSNTFMNIPYNGRIVNRSWNKIQGIWWPRQVINVFHVTPKNSDAKPLFLCCVVGVPRWKIWCILISLLFPNDDGGLCKNTTSTLNTIVTKGTKHEITTKLVFTLQLQRKSGWTTGSRLST